MQKSVGGIEDQIAAVVSFCKDNQHSSFYHSLPESGGRFSGLPSYSASDFAAVDPRELVHTDATKVRFLHSAFESATEDFFLYPEHLETEWENVRRLCTEVQPSSVAIAVPSLWQASEKAYRTVREQKIPFVYLSPKNFPVLEQVIREAQVEVMITTAEQLRVMQQELVDPTVLQTIQSWLIVAPVGTSDLDITVEADVTIEYHVLPGVPVAWATFDTTKQTLGQLQYSPHYHFEFAEGGEIASVTSLRPDALPFIRYRCHYEN